MRKQNLYVDTGGQELKQGLHLEFTTFVDEKRAFYFLFLLAIKYSICSIHLSLAIRWHNNGLFGFVNKLDKVICWL